MLAVRVPPSACSTSQSTVTCRSPSSRMSQAARRLRAINRWISTVRPLCLPFAASRPTRSGDEPGNIEYSAVTQPLPLLRIQRGTSSSMLAVHSTRVRPNVTSADPSAISVKSRSNVIGRSSSACRPSDLVIRPPWHTRRAAASAGRCRADQRVPHGSVWFSSGPSSCAPSSRNVSRSPLERKRCVPHRLAVAQEAQLTEDADGRERCLIGRADERHPGTHHLSDRAGEERIVGAPEQQGVDVRGRHRGEHPFGEHEHLVAGGLTPFHELDEARARGAGEVHRSTRAGDRLNVRAGGDRSDRPDHADASGRGRADECSCAGFDDVDDRQRELRREDRRALPRRRVAGDDDRLDAVVVDEAVGNLGGEAVDVGERFGPYG